MADAREGGLAMRLCSRVVRLLSHSLVVSVLVRSAPSERQAPPAEALAFGAYSSMGTIPALVQSARQAHQHQVSIERSVSRAHFQGSAPTDGDGALRDLIANSDAIIEGSIEQRKCALTADESFIYSDYVVRIDDIYKKDAPHAIGDSIHIVHPGGVLHNAGVDVVALDPQAVPIEAGRKYLFFLHNLKNSSAYKAGAQDVADMSNPLGAGVAKTSTIHPLISTKDFSERVHSLSNNASGN